MDDEPEAFVLLRQGKRVMVLRHQRGRCRYLGRDDRCTIYSSRPLGCRVFPFDPDFSARGKLRRLRLTTAVQCPYELDGHNRISDLRILNAEFEAATRAFHERVAGWNRVQRARRRMGRAAQTAAEFLAFLGVAPAPPVYLRRSTNGASTRQPPRPRLDSPRQTLRSDAARRVPRMRSASQSDPAARKESTHRRLLR
jgi:Fe-S-cluster containining protein